MDNTSDAPTSGPTAAWELSMEDHALLSAALEFMDECGPQELLSGSHGAVQEEEWAFKVEMEHGGGCASNANGVGDGDDIKANADANMDAAVAYEPATNVGEWTIKDDVPRMVPWTPLALPSVSSSTSSMAAATAEKESTRPRAKRKRGPNRQRQELLYLRDTVVELEARLDTLQTKARAPEEAFLPANKADESRALAPTLSTVWQGIATRQSAQREQAEIENTRLRHMLEDQIKVAKSLEGLIKKRANVELLAPLHPPSSNKRVQTMQNFSPVDIATVRTELMDGLPSMYEQTNSVFADPRFARLDSFRDVHTRGGDKFGTVVEILQNRYMPFTMEQSTRALWHHLTQQAAEARSSDQENIELSEDAMLKVFTSKISSSHKEGDCRCLLGARKYEEAERVVLVWSGLTDPVSISNTPMDGLLMRQCGWTIIQRKSMPFATREITQMLSYHMARPDIYGSVFDSQHKVGKLADFLLQAINTHHEIGQQMIDNFLLAGKGDE